MSLECPPDGGTVFRIELPRVARISEEEIAASSDRDAHERTLVS
jgi:hypothetical protein